nr:MAG TPA: hypothetical protein [Caudoviricetes sp.]
MAQISSYVDPDLGQALINNTEVEVDNNISPDVPTTEEETKILKDIAEATPDADTVAEITQKEEDIVNEASVAEAEQPKVFSTMNNKKNKKNKK